MTIQTNLLSASARWLAIVTVLGVSAILVWLADEQPIIAQQSVLPRNVTFAAGDAEGNNPHQAFTITWETATEAIPAANGFLVRYGNNVVNESIPGGGTRKKLSVIFPRQAGHYIPLVPGQSSYSHTFVDQGIGSSSPIRPNNLDYAAEVAYAQNATTTIDGATDHEYSSNVWVTVVGATAKGVTFTQANTNHPQLTPKHVDEGDEFSIGLLNHEAPLLAAGSFDVVLETTNETADEEDITFDSPFVSSWLPDPSASKRRVVGIGTLDDSIVEPDETFILRLDNRSGGIERVRTAPHRVTIRDNDTAQVSVTAVSSGPLPEDVIGGTPSRASFQITLDSEVAADVTGSWEVIVDPARLTLADISLTQTTGTFRFPAGTSAGATFPINIDIVDDSRPEFAEDLTLRITSVDADLPGRTDAVQNNPEASTATILIAASDVPLITGLTVDRGNADGYDRDKALTVSWDAPTDLSVTGFVYRYVLIPKGGQEPVWLSPVFLNDIETREVELTGLIHPDSTYLIEVAATTGENQPFGWVRSESVTTAPHIEASIRGDVTVSEGDEAEIEVVLSGPRSSRQGFAFITDDGTAVAGTDYTRTPASEASVFVEPGQTSATIRVSTTENQLLEEDRSFTVRINKGSSTDVTLDPTSITVTIQDDDAQAPLPQTVTIVAGDGSGVDQDRLLTVSWTPPTYTTGLTHYVVQYAPVPTPGQEPVWSAEIIPSGGASARTLSIRPANQRFTPGDYQVRIRAAFADRDPAWLEGSTPASVVAPIGLFIADTALTANELSGAAGSIEIPVQLTSARSDAVTFRINYLDQSASTDDFASSPTSGSISAGQTQTTVIFAVTTDDLVEGDETLQASLELLGGEVEVNPSRAEITILDHDQTQLSVGTANPALHPEEPSIQGMNNSFEIPINLTQAVVAAVTLDWHLTGAETSDVEGGVLSGTHTIPAGTTSFTHTIIIADDTDQEAAEIWTYTISNLTTTLERTNTQTALSIDLTNNETTLTVSQSDTPGPAIDTVTAVAGDENRADPDRVIRATWDAPADNQISGYQAQFRYKTGTGPWGEWADATVSGTTALIPSSETIQTDRVYQFQVAAQKTATVPQFQISNEIAPIPIVVSIVATDLDLQHPESNLMPTIGLELNHPRTSATIIDVETTPGTATPVSDYIPANFFNRVTFSAGSIQQSLTLRTFDDGTPEENETYTVTISTRSQGVGVDSNQQTATITILDDDIPTPENLAVTVGNENEYDQDSSIFLEWDPPQSFDDRVIGYEVRHRTRGSNSWETSVSYPNTQRSHTFGGLRPSSQYETSVRAIGTANNSVWETIPSSSTHRLNTASITESTITIIEGENSEVSIELSGPLSEELNLQLRATTTASADKFSFSDRVVLRPGEVTKSITFDTNQDNDFDDEEISLTLHPTIATQQDRASPTPLIITIIDDDLPLPEMVTVSAGDENGYSADRKITIGWQLAGTNTQSHLNYRVRHREQGATNWEDPQIPNLTEGHNYGALDPETTYEFSVRRFELNKDSGWSAPIAATTSSPITATLSAEQDLLEEGSSIDIDVTLSGPHSSPVNLTFPSQSATNPNIDVTHVNNVIFAPGDTTKTITVTANHDDDTMNGLYILAIQPLSILVDYLVSQLVIFVVDDDGIRPVGVSIAPGDVDGIDRDQTITAHWLPPEENMSYNGFEVQLRQFGSTEWEPAISKRLDQLSHTFTNLQPATTYQIRIRMVGSSDPSLWVFYRDTQTEPAISASFAQITHIVAEGGTVSVEVILSGPRSEPVTIPVVVANRTAQSNDYVLDNLLTIPPGELSATFGFDTIDDQIDEPDETITISLDTEGSSDNIHLSSTARTETTIIITDIDLSPPQAVRAVVGSQTGTDPDQALTVSWETPTTLTGIDGYELQIRAVGAPIWEPAVSKTVTELTHTFTHLHPDTEYEIRSRTTGTNSGSDWVNLEPVSTLAPVTARLSPDQYRLTEGTGTDIHVILSGTRSVPVTLNLEFINISASSDDFSLNQLSVDFAVGQISQTVRLVTNNDNRDELSETFQIRVDSSNIIGDVQPGFNHPFFTIIDDDEPPVVAGSASPPRSIDALPGDQIRQNPHDSITVSWQPPVSLPTGFEGYQLRSRALGSVPNPWTAPIDKTSDQLSHTLADLDPNTEYQIQLQTVASGVESDWVSLPATVTTYQQIAVAFQPTTLQITEGESATVDIELGQAHHQEIILSVESQAETATTNDFQPVRQVIIFGAGETTKTVTITTIDDTETESTETFTVRMFPRASPPGLVLQLPEVMQIRITDNETSPNPPSASGGGGTSFPTGGTPVGGNPTGVIPEGGTPGSTPDSSSGDASSFIDATGNTHEANIERLASSGITRGCNPPINDRYCPDRVVTRAEMATFLVRAFDLRATETGLFTDTGTNTHRQNINILAANQITLGCNPPENSRYCPDRPVTRAQMGTFLARALGLVAGSGEFTDTVNSVHRNDINRIAAAGITRGCNPPENSRYCPERPVTRAEMATFLTRAQNLP